MRGFAVHETKVTTKKTTFKCKAEGCGAEFSSKIEAEKHWAHLHAAKRTREVGDFRPDIYYFFETQEDAQLWMKYVYKCHRWSQFIWDGPGFYRTFGTSITSAQSEIASLRTSISQTESKIENILRTLEIDG